ncbi:IclR family transcriptional regulator [Corallincola holothuriorum]|uniref:IclR family transcriptional regulator n=1 Tax=Corallincola holothuriorum TaxID=2282215 RepID=UPI0011C075B7|nr:helix-turn-helix domain-containing protein [Corallincola holothuriorum]
MATKPQSEKSSYTAPALEKGLDILELLAQQSGPLSKNQIAEKLERSINEIFRMLSILEARGYLRIDDAGGIQLSMRLWQMAHRYPPQDRLRAMALPVMQQLSQELVQSCHLVVPEEENLVVAARQESPGKMGFTVRLGTQVDVFESTSGWLLLALAGDSMQQRLWNSQAVNPKLRQQLAPQLESIRRDRRLVRESMQIKGILNISFPICNEQGEAFAVLTVPYLGAYSDNLNEPSVSQERAITACMKAAQAIQRQLGFQPDKLA